MRKRTKRKVRPLINTVSYVMEGVRITTDKLLDQLRIRELAAIDAFTRGMAGEQEWHDINAMVGITRMMAKNRVGPEAIPACDQASDALQADWNRYKVTGKMGTSGAGLQAYRDTFRYHDLQRQSVSRAEYERHIQAATKKVNFIKESV